MTESMREFIPAGLVRHESPVLNPKSYYGYLEKAKREIRPNRHALAMQIIA